MILYSVLGVEILFEELYYPYINHYWAFLALCIRSSVGDIQSPLYKFWLSAGDQGYINVQFSMIYTIWLVWFCTLFINLVILLNFLIAIIS